MAKVNPLRKFHDKVNQYPQWLTRRLLTWAFRFNVKLAGTAKIEILESDGKSVLFRQRNYKRVQNHIGSIHAAGMALLAESATGFVTGINLPGDKLPLIKRMDLKYVKRATGDMTARAWLTDEQIEKMQTEEKGDVIVNVEVTDALGVVPIECEMEWAWISKK